MDWMRKKLFSASSTAQSDTIASIKAGESKVVDSIFLEEQKRSSTLFPIPNTDIGRQPSVDSCTEAFADSEDQQEFEEEQLQVEEVKVYTNFRIFQKKFFWWKFKYEFGSEMNGTMTEETHGIRSQSAMSRSSGEIEV